MNKTEDAKKTFIAFIATVAGMLALLLLYSIATGGL